MEFRLKTVLLVLSTVAVALAISLPLQANHSFTVTAVTFNETSASITAEPTQPSALNLVMEARLCDASNTTTYTGDQSTFTAIGEQFVFTVGYPEGTFGPGENVIVSVTDSIGTSDCNDGNEGYFGTWPYTGPTGPVPPIPTLRQWGMLLLALALLLIGGHRLHGMIIRRA